jgi:protein O-GlcNAc transferase
MTRRSSRKRMAILVVGVTMLFSFHGSSGQAVSAALKQADVAYRAGQAALEREDLGAAQTDFEQVVKLVPHAEQGHSALGAVLVSRGHLKEGIRELVTALSILKTDSTAQMNLAMAYQQIGLSAKAIPLFSEIEAEARSRQQILPSFVLAAHARALAANGKLNDAAAKMQAALNAEPTSADLHDELGSIYAQQESLEPARREFTTAIQLNSKLAAAHLHLGLAMLAQGMSGGVSELELAKQLAPENPIMTLELGRAYATAGQDDRAIPLFRRLLEGDTNSTEAMYQLALALQRSNQVQEAIALLHGVLKAEPDNAMANINLGLALTQTQLAKDAVPVLQRAISLAPTSAIAYQNLAAAYVQLSQFDDAVRELNTALKLSSDSPQLHYDLGLALKMKDEPAGAIPELEAAEKLDPNAPEAPYVLGTLYMQAARYEDAVREIKRSLLLRPENGEGWATLGSLYSKLNLLPEAASALREAIKQLPEQPAPHLTLAAVLSKQNQAIEAISERKIAAGLMRTNMNRQRAQVATNSGNSLLKSGDLAAATVQFRDALSFDSDYSEAHLGLARIFDAQGKAMDAAAERQKALKPSNSEPAN